MTVWHTGSAKRRAVAATVRDAAILLGAVAVDIGLLDGSVYRAAAEALGLVGRLFGL